MNEADAPTFAAATPFTSRRGDESPGGRAVSRRRLLRSAAGLAAFWGVVGAESARARATPPTDVSADVDPSSLLNKLVRRVTMGFTQAEQSLANSMGYQAYLEYHLNYTAIDDSALNAQLAALTTLTMTPSQLYLLTAGQVISELTEAVIRRGVFSNRQLFERVVEFWTDHFNIQITNEDDQYLKTVDDRDVVRANALGAFPALLSASAHSPAMLFYLNNNISVAGNPNENYARELMELHTLGVNGGYTQNDVHEVARCFTGWQYYLRGTGSLQGTFRFNAAQHDNASKVVLGNTIPANGGIQDGVTVLNILSNHPSTATFIATKLCRRFIGEDASAATISAVAATYTSTGGDIKAMLRTALQPNVLADATPRYKRPFHLFVSAMRALPTAITSVTALRTQLAGTGHQPYYWIAPDGYPDTLTYWSGLILPRWGFGASLLTNSSGTAGGISGLTVDVPGFLSGLTTAQQIVDRIDQAMFGGEMPASDKARIRTYLLPDPPSTIRQRDAIGLAIGSPGFQWY